MAFVLDAVYLLSLLLLSPWLLYQALITGKQRRGLWTKLTGQVRRREGDTRCAWFHGVSLGEICLLEPIIARFRKRHPEWECVVSTSTETGFGEAYRRFPGLSVFYWPVDFTWAVRRALRRVNPGLVILAEGEVWPNFLAAAKKRGTPIGVVNARLSPRSLRGYRMVPFLAQRLFGGLNFLAVQTEEFAAAFQALGVPAQGIVVTGSVKFDGAETDRHNSRTRELGWRLRIEPTDLVWIAGSTQPPEEEIVLDIFRRLKPRHPNLRLLLVPRQKDRFDEVANLLKERGENFQRRSNLEEAVGEGADILLVDSIGELGALWGLADVAFVGGSLDGRRGGQNMIEPAAVGAAVIFGPHVWNFADTARRLVEAGVAFQVADATALEAVMGRLLASPGERKNLEAAARNFVLLHQGASERTMDVLDSLIGSGSAPRSAA